RVAPRRAAAVVRHRRLPGLANAGWSPGGAAPRRDRSGRPAHRGAGARVPVMKRFPLSAMLTSLPLDFGTACARAAELGFTHIDIVALADRPPGHYDALADSALLVACAGVGRDLPSELGLDVAAVARRREAVELVKRQIADAARLGATRAYLVSGTDP